METTNADDVRSTEHERITALLQGNMEVAHRLHANDFQLITPLGVVLSKDEYLGAVAAGQLHYLFWEVDSPIDVRLHGDIALIRYLCQIQIEVNGEAYPRAAYRFTDSYERRDGYWQIVWSQGTASAS